MASFRGANGLCPSTSMTLIQGSSGLFSFCPPAQSISRNHPTTATRTYRHGTRPIAFLHRSRVCPRWENHLARGPANPPLNPSLGPRPSTLCQPQNGKKCHGHVGPKRILIKPPMFPKPKEDSYYALNLKRTKWVRNSSRKPKVVVFLLVSREEKKEEEAQNQQSRPHKAPKSRIACPLS